MANTSAAPWLSQSLSHHWWLDWLTEGKGAHGAAWRRGRWSHSSKQAWNFNRGTRISLTRRRSTQRAKTVSTHLVRSSVNSVKSSNDELRGFWGHNQDVWKSLRVSRAYVGDPHHSQTMLMIAYLCAPLLGIFMFSSLSSRYKWLKCQRAVPLNSRDKSSSWRRSLEEKKLDLLRDFLAIELRVTFCSTVTICKITSVELVDCTYNERQICRNLNLWNGNKKDNSS